MAIRCGDFMHDYRKTGSMKQSTGWRNLDTDTRKEFMAWVEEQHAKRSGPWSMGRDKYGDVFEGDPVEQMVEEALDAVFYAWVAMRRNREVTP